MNNGSSGVVTGILIVVVIAIVGWIAYTQGFFKAKEEAKDDNSLQINFGGSSEKKSQ